MGSAPHEHDRRRAEVLEALAELCLRLNGYFCVRNYLLHLAGLEEFGLSTEFDLLAVRMPHQQEVLEDGRHQPNDPALTLDEDEDLVDCLIAEVKEPSVEFNRSVRGPDGEQRIAAALGMFGVLPKGTFTEGGVAHRLAHDLHQQINNACWLEIPRACDSEFRISVRMLVFAPETAKHARERKHLDLQHILDFTKARMRPKEQCARYRDPERPTASPWRGWTRRIICKSSCGRYSGASCPNKAQCPSGANAGSGGSGRG
jgi:hypothetical protein